MIVKSIFKSKSDFKNFSKSECVAYNVAIRFYQNETEFTERIKEKSLPLTTLFNCVSTIILKLKEEEYPEAFVDEIWDDIKHIRGKQNSDNKTQLVRERLNIDYEFNVNRWYEATVIFACVYTIMAIECPEKEVCLKYIKEKSTYNEDAKHYFEPFEQAIVNLKENQRKYPEAYGIEKKDTIEEQRKFTELEWLANEKHFSWKFDKLRTILADKTIDEQIIGFNEEFKREKQLPNPSEIYLDLLDIQIKYLQRQCSQNNSPIIKVNDIISALQENKFSPAKSVQILEIINYILYARQYPEDICGNIDKKINLFKQNIQSDEEDTETQKNAQKRTLKVTTDVIIALLKEAGYVANNDNTKIARLISYLTGFSEEKIRQRFSYPDELTSYHKEEVEIVNKILADINSQISIKYNKQR